MFDLQEYICQQFTQHPIKKVLDLGAGDGRFSILSASFGAKVTAVDSRQMRNYNYPTYLEQHPAIDFVEDNLVDFIDQLSSEYTYDLVLLLNVLVFLPKDQSLFTITKTLSHLAPGGRLLVTFFFADDETISTNKELSFYHFEDFEIPEGFEIRDTQDVVVEETHKPYGLHTHHIGYIKIERV